MNTDPRLIDHEKRIYIAVKEQVRAVDPNIDERTLADTVEGLTNLTDILAATLRAVRKDEALAKALETIIDEERERLDRILDRAKICRDIVRDAMDAVGMKNLTMPDFTASLRPAQPHVVVVDENLIPQTYWEQRRHLRKRELGDDLKDGRQIAGAVLSNPGMTLTVRTR